MKFYTTIEIDEIETEVAITFEMYFGQAEVIKITNVETGDAIDAEISDWTYLEMIEYAADMKAEKSYTRYNYDY